MINDNSNLFLVFGIFSMILGACGFYCIMVTKNFIRTLIGLEILTKSVTLLIIAAGYASNRIALAQSMVITLIVVEVVVIAVGAGIVFGIFKQIGSLNVTKLRNLKG
ncbi:MAG: NADH-quinone oxidoreductase subunit K [bacterium]